LLILLLRVVKLSAIVTVAVESTIYTTKYPWLFNWTRTTSLTLPLFIEVPVPSQEIEW
jgi:hypothetical protein